MADRNFQPFWLTTENLSTFVKQALKEDIGPGDYSSLASIPADAISSAKLLVKDTGIIAGVEMAEFIFKTVDPNLQLTTFITDGKSVNKGDAAFEVSGSAISILSSERLVLNCMQRMSGIATKSNALAKMIDHTKCRLLDTRKTTPNFRIAEKWAVAIGGAYNHRYGLYDMVMLKDNHIDFAGGITSALKRTKQYLKEQNLDLKIEVETRNLAELEEALNTGLADRIMLDNYSLENTTKAVELVKGRVELESSGGITSETLVSYAETGVNFISVGALTHSAGILDLSLKAK